MQDLNPLPGDAPGPQLNTQQCARWSDNPGQPAFEVGGVWLIPEQPQKLMLPFHQQHYTLFKAYLRQTGQTLPM